MSELLLSADAFVVPSVEGKPHVLDMRKIHRAEARLVELNGVTKAKAGELNHCFIEAFSEARRYQATLRAEFGRSKQKVRSVRGVVVLDRAAAFLKERGLSSTRSPAGSEDLRDSVVNTDPEYLAAADRLAQVEAALEHIEGKVEVLKMAYYAVSDLIQGSDLSRREVSGGAGDDEPGALSQGEKLQQFVDQHSNVDASHYTNGFGVPKY